MYIWLSFADHQFKGACVVEITDVDKAEAHAHLTLRHMPTTAEAVMTAAAVSKAWRTHCNPGGQVALIEIPAEQWHELQQAGAQLSTLYSADQWKVFGVLDAGPDETTH